MEMKRVEEVAGQYYAILTSALGDDVEAKRLPIAVLGVNINLMDRLDSLGHMAWMCVELKTMANDGRTEKAMRWLGFLQGALWMCGLRTIEQLKYDNMPTQVSYDSSRI